MAWNEPGGSGNKDPWGGGRDQGPPDLDEVVKKMQDKFGSLFGGKKGGGGGGAGSGKGGSVGIGLIVIVAVVAWGLSGIYIIEEGKRGVVLQFGAYKETTLPGPHWYPRFIQSVDEVDISTIRDATIGYRSGGSTRQTSAPVERESLMLTQDENIVDVQLAVQYKVKNASDYLFKIKDPDITLRQSTESAVREIIGKNKMEFVITEGRTEIARRVHDLTQEILDRYQTGLEITSVNMQDAQPPEAVQAAFDDAVKAREDNVRLKNEAEAYANDIIPKAQGRAARDIAEANGYKEQVIAEAQGETARFLNLLTEYKKAPEVTRKRLYLETVESVMVKSSKIMVDVKGGNNLIYLPLDRLMEQRTPVTTQAPRNMDSVPPATNQTTEPRRREVIRRGER
ncbi:MAG: FtsH protease activity modulator HflK [Gammaproteobacteria bacterium]|jgi:membrane protease subunit HflK|nr:FtsH protease activity modulator HflK [Gammaproteobacteria bacterium]